ncbi:hypothetical protein [Thauera sp. Sel9]|uniref:hypothetical protein n=1 Tax=Thauera sp. Sel9 TaxID=2974299 RepID=UPI0021E13AF8|nr:hypothetical protein [Thauera sp. Sel9]MCV2216542.1 hypothetical protein [Thauera sp. Sel9]
MTEEEQFLYDCVPSEIGKSITNPDLLRRLNWDQEKYWRTRNGLVDRGILTVARGRGGLVYRAVQPDAAADTYSSEQTVTAPLQIREEELYAPLSSVLRQEWTREKRLERSIVHITARQGRRDTGGRWSRPDLVVVTQSTYPYVPGRHFDVITFEVKPSDSIDVTAVYEALAHRRAATKAYVALHVPDTDAENLKNILTEVYSEAKRHGVGVITFSQPEDFATWDEVVEAARMEPDPGRLNDFLVAQFESNQLEIILRWFR